jgi:hypothetical protein
LLPVVAVVQDAAVNKPVQVEGLTETMEVLTGVRK